MRLTLHHILFITLTCLLTCGALFYHGFPFGHDYAVQAVMYDAFKGELLSGTLYPRWLSDINHGFGGSNFFFYPPLTHFTYFILDAASFFSLTTNQIMSLGAGFTVLLSGLSFYIFARHITSPGTSLFLALLYMTLPYHFLFEISVRSAIAELYAYVWIPLIFLSIRKIFNYDYRYVIAFPLLYALLILTHMPSALLVTIFAGLYWIALSIKHHSPIPQCYRRIYISALCGIIGLGLSSFYLIPALGLIDQMNAAFMWVEFLHFENWFLFFPERQCPDAALCNNYTFLITSQLVICTALLAIMLLKKHVISQDAIFIFGLMLLAAFMMSPLSIGIWNAIPPLQKVQFPWRILALSDFFFVAFLAYCSNSIITLSKNTRVTFIASLLCIHIATALFLVPILTEYNRTYKYKEHSEIALKTKLITFEYSSNSPAFTLSPIDFLKSTPPNLVTASHNRAEITVIKEQARLITFDINSTEPTTIELRRFWFKGWNIYRDGIKITDDVNLRAVTPYGHVAFDAPAGKFTLSARLDTLIEEQVGVMITAIALILYLIALTTIIRIHKTQTRKKEA